MTDLVPTGRVALAPSPAPLPPAVSSPSCPTLPEPLLEGTLPLDALGRLLTMVERQGLASMNVTEHKLAHTREQLRTKLEQLMSQLQAAARRAQEGSHDRHKGLFARAAEAFGDATAKLVGAAVEVLHDSVVVPADLVVSVAEHAGDWQAMKASLANDLCEISKRSDMQRSFESFVEGTTRFAGTLLEFTSTLALELAAAAPQGQRLDEVLRARAEELWTSLEENILNNPGFWETVGTLAKAAAVAGTVMTGGALGIVAIALIAVLEADKRYGLIEKTVGKEAAPFVRIGVELAFALCTAAAAGAGDANRITQLLQAGTGLVSGAGGIYQGVRVIREGDQQADELERQAAVQATMNELGQLQRLVDSLLELLKDRSESHTTTQQLEAALARAAAATEGAVFVKA